jgi:hypothetical protein
MQANSTCSQNSVMRTAGIREPTRRVAWQDRRVWLPGAARNEINGIHRPQCPNRGARGSMRCDEDDGQKAVIARV